MPTPGATRGQADDWGDADACRQSLVPRVRLVRQLWCRRNGWAAHPVSRFSSRPSPCQVSAFHWHGIDAARAIPRCDMWPIGSRPTSVERLARPLAPLSLKSSQSLQHAMFAQSAPFSSRRSAPHDCRAATARMMRQLKGSMMPPYLQKNIFRPVRSLGLVVLLGASVAACSMDSGDVRSAARANLASETALNAQIMSDRARAQRCDRDPSRRECPRVDRDRAERDRAWRCERDPTHRECRRR